MANTNEGEQEPVVPVVEEPTDDKGFKGTPPVENIDDKDGDVEDDFSKEFGDLALEMLADDGVEVPDLDVPKEEPKEEPEVKPKEPEVEEPKEEPEPKPDEHEEAEPSPKDKGEEESQTPEPEPELTPEQIQANAAKVQKDALEARDKLVSQIEESITFTEDETKRLREEPETVLPKMVANLYVDVHNAVMQSITSQLPRMLGQVQVQQKAQDQATQSFQDTWKSLDLGKKEHMDVVSRMGATYRQMNPTASQEQFIREVGAQAMIALRIPLTVDMGLVEPKDTPTIPPHKPVSSSGPSPAPKSSADSNPFEVMAEEFLEDDRS